MPEGVSTAAVAAASGVTDEHLARAEPVAVGAVRRRLRDPLAAPLDEIADRHQMIVRAETD